MADDQAPSELEFVIEHGVFDDTRRADRNDGVHDLRAPGSESAFAELGQRMFWKPDPDTTFVVASGMKGCKVFLPPQNVGDPCESFPRSREG